jgi:dienelactone hydrolase
MSFQGIAADVNDEGKPDLNMIRAILFQFVATSLLILALSATGRAQSLLSGAWTVTSPEPSGDIPVGTLSLRLVDAARTDPYRPNSGKRELVVRFWYPAAYRQPCRTAEYASPKVWTYFSQISGFPLPAVRSHSCPGVAAAAGARPVILFSHGYTATLTDATFIFEDLASRGFVVASIAHTYETTAVEFPDARLITSLFGSYLSEGSLQMDYGTLHRVRSVRLADLSFVLNELQRVDANDRVLAGRLDLSRIGVMGHSLGGEIALAGLEHDARIGAAVSLDGAVSAEVTAGTSKPVLLLAAGRERWSPEECHLWTALRGARLAINLQGADHFTPTDAIWLFQSVPGMSASVGGMGRQRTITALRNYIAAFFDTNLRGRPPNALLSAPSAKYPDAIVSNQTLAPCRQNASAAKGGLQ